MAKLLGIKKIAYLSGPHGNPTEVNRSRVINKVSGANLGHLLEHDGDYATAPKLYSPLAVYWAAIFFHMTEWMTIEENLALLAMQGTKDRIYNDAKPAANLQTAVDGIAKGQEWGFTVQFSLYTDGQTDLNSACHPIGEPISAFGSTSADIISQITINLNALFFPITPKLA